MRLRQRPHAMAAVCAALTLLAGCHLPATSTHLRSKVSPDEAVLQVVEKHATGEPDFLKPLEREQDGWDRSVEHLGDIRSHASPQGPVMVVSHYGLDEYPPGFEVAALTPDGAVRWSQELRSRISFNDFHGMRSELSPDGRFLGLTAASHDLHPLDQAVVAYAVLDTETGSVVRTGTEAGVLLGMSLTNTDMVIQTSGTDFPAGLDWSENPHALTGPSTLTRLPLADRQAAAQVQHTDLWLVAADGESLFLSDTPLRNLEERELGKGFATVSLMDTSGTVTGTVTGVKLVSPDGVLHRCEPQADGDTEDTQTCELYAPGTGARTPTTGLFAQYQVGATQNLIQLYQQVVETTPDGEKTKYVLASWSIGAATPSTDPQTECSGIIGLSCRTTTIPQAG